MKTSDLPFRSALLAAVLCTTAAVGAADVHADSNYSAKSGKISFTVGSNVPLLKVNGSTTSVVGGGEAEINGNSATVRNLRFEVDPSTLKTGMKLRDQHMYEKVFTAADGSIPKVVLRAERLQAALNPQSSKWEGQLQGQLTIRGVTRPVSFTAAAEKNGSGAVVTAQGTVKTSDFGVKPISYSGATVDEEVTITVSNLVVAP